MSRYLMTREFFQGHWEWDQFPCDWEKLKEHNLIN